MFEKSRFFEAVQKGDIDAVRAMHAARPELVNAAKGWGDNTYKPLWVAMKKHNGKMIDCLLELGARPEERIGPSHNHALHVAVSEGLQKYIQQFAESYPGLLDKPNKVGGTALMMAAEKGDNDAIVYLLALGADRNIKSTIGRTAADWAAANGKMSSVALLTSALPPPPRPPSSLPPALAEAAPMPQQTRETNDAEESCGWTKLSDDRIAYVADDAVIGLRLMTVFNFSTCERTRVTQNLRTGFEKHETQDFGDMRDLTSLEAACRAMAERGVSVDDAQLLAARKKQLMLPGR